MSDNTSLRGDRDRRTVSASEPYEVGYFARKHGLTIEQARDLIARVGNDRSKLDAAAEAMRG
ncbi:MAG TPA: DUF3606 domain-containing protein [Sphingomicrobium sp.]|nr:DUF3606 domain-containing protein [Sphingomicrobium sp.]